jgi:hypothetical protein
LEIFNRIPHTEQLVEFVPQLLRMAMQLLRDENEENAIICLRIIIDLHKNFRYHNSNNNNNNNNIVTLICTEASRLTIL